MLVFCRGDIKDIHFGGSTNAQAAWVRVDVMFLCPVSMVIHTAWPATCRGPMMPTATLMAPSTMPLRLRHIMSTGQHVRGSRPPLIPILHNRYGDGLFCPCAIAACALTAMHNTPGTGTSAWRSDAVWLYSSSAGSAAHQGRPRPTFSLFTGSTPTTPICGHTPSKSN